MPTASIIIPTLDRRDSLRDCQESLWNQTYQDYDIRIISYEGPLAQIRNEGAKMAHGEYVVFIDDDVICDPNWLQSIVDIFTKRPEVAGVSGPAIITKEYRKNRDIFRFKFIHDAFTGFSRLPGHISKAGAWTMGAASETCSYEGPVEFLEACNMAFRLDAFNAVGGFDESYRGIGDWSEPDLSFRIRGNGGQLWFCRNARVEHRPSRSGAFLKRDADAQNRLRNYELFSNRWVKPCWEHSLYKQILKTYYDLKTTK